MINEAYRNQNISVTIDDIHNWIKHKVYNKNLWICIKKIIILSLVV